MAKPQTARISVSEYRAITTKGKAKYRNSPCVADGMRFDSKLEARRYQELKALQAAGAVRWFIRQVSFLLEGGVRYRADFLVVWRLGDSPQLVSVEDVKGYLTPMSALKIRQVEARYGIKMDIIGKR